MHALLHSLVVLQQLLVAIPAASSSTDAGFSHHWCTLQPALVHWPALLPAGSVLGVGYLPVLHTLSLQAPLQHSGVPSVAGR